MHRLIGCLILLALLARPVSAQRPFENGSSLQEFASGLQGPASLARDASGVLYVSSIYDKNGSGFPTDIFRVLPDGTVETFTASIVDPDVLCLDAAGFVYVGAWSGKITRVNPNDGSQSTWVHDSRLGNVDGLLFDPAADLLVTAIDHKKIHKVNAATKAIQVFADLSALNLQGLGSIVRDPADGSYFVASPKDGQLLHLNADGSLADAALASGFQHMGQLAIDGDTVLVSDNVGAAIYRVDRATRAVTPLVFDVSELAGALWPVGGGTFYASRQSADLLDGRIYRIDAMTLGLSGPPVLGSSIRLDLDSPADAGRPLYLFLTLNPGSVPLPDGRAIPLEFSLFLLFAGTFDAQGHWSLPLSIPHDQNLIGLTAYAGFLTTSPGQPGIWSISNALPITVQ